MKGRDSVMNRGPKAAPAHHSVPNPDTRIHCRGMTIRLTRSTRSRRLDRLASTTPPMGREDDGREDEESPGRTHQIGGERLQHRVRRRARLSLAS